MPPHFLNYWYFRISERHFNSIRSTDFPENEQSEGKVANVRIASPHPGLSDDINNALDKQNEEKPKNEKGFHSFSTIFPEMKLLNWLNVAKVISLVIFHLKTFDFNLDFLVYLFLYLFYFLESDEIFH